MVPSVPDQAANAIEPREESAVNQAPPPAVANGVEESVLVDGEDEAAVVAVPEQATEEEAEENPAVAVPIAGVGGAVCVFAKCPIVGVCKTRLAPLLGSDGAASLAEAMLSDVLVSLSECSNLCNTLKVLVYAPDTAEGESHMASILQSLHLSCCKADDISMNRSIIFSGSDTETINDWVLLPMTSTEPNSNVKSDLNSTSLGAKLEDALKRTRRLIDSDENPNKAVLFLGMDSPELPMDEVVYGLQIASGYRGLMPERNHGQDEREEFEGRAHMCPADDGGYGLLSVPGHTPSSEVFSGVVWSSQLTALSQLKAITDAGVAVSIGRLMHDIDEPSDVRNLAARLARSQCHGDGMAHCSFSLDQDSMTEGVVLTSPSSGISTVLPTGVPAIFPYHTWTALVDLGMIKSHVGENGNTALWER